MRKFTLFCLICMIGMISEFNSSAVEPVDLKPTWVLKQSSHPHIFFEASDIPTLQAQAASTHQEIWETVREFAESEFGSAPPAEAPDGGVSTYRYYGNILIPFALACAITEDQDYCNLAKTYLLTYASWDQWGEDGGKRDLGHAHMLLGNALAYDWIYNYLTPTEQQTVRDSLADWAQKMYEASSGSKNSEWSNWWSKSYMQNHYATTHSALGVAGLALLGEDDRAQTWIDQASGQLGRLHDMLNGMSDGSWHESINYQNYMLTTYLVFAVALRDVQGTDILADTYLQNYPYWRIYNHLPDSTRFIMSYGNFEWDWGNGYRPQNILRFIAAEYNDGYAQWMAQELNANDTKSANQYTAPWHTFGFFYYDPSVAALAPNNLEKSRIFSDLEGVIWRTGWEQDDLVFGLKTGAYGGRFAFDTFTQEAHPWETPCVDTRCQLNIGHAHDDTNGFYLYRAGHWLTPESEGYENYDTNLHNTLLIDGQGQYRPPFEESTFWRDPDYFIGSDGFLETAANTTCFDYVAADATRRYKNISGIEDITRHVVFIRPNYLVMLDNLAADAAHQYTWVSHFSGGVSVDGNWVRGEADDQQILGVGIISPQSFQTTTGDDGKPYVRIQPSSSSDDARFINVLYPTNQTFWETRPTLSLLEDTGEAAAIRVQRNDGSARSDDILLTYTDTLTTRAIGPYQYDGQVAAMTLSSGGELDKLFVFGGTFLKDQTEDTMLVSNLDPNEPFEVVYFEQTAVVNGNILTEVTLYAPHAERLIVNGRLQTFTRSGNYITFDGSDLGTFQPPITNICTRPVELAVSLYLPIILKQ